MNQKLPTGPLPPWGLIDYYAMFMIAILSPVAVPVYMVLVPLLLIPLLWLRMYMCCLPKPLRNVPPTCGFYFIATIAFLLSLPTIVITIVYFIFITVATHSLAFVYALFTGHLFRGAFKSWRLVWPYMKVGRVSWFDYVRGILGILHRQGFIEFWLGKPFRGCLAATVAFMPLTRYCLVCNPFLHDLEEIYICQATKAFPELDCKAVISAFKCHISNTFEDPHERDAIDSNKFCAHYQHPPESRKVPIVVGMQWTELTKTFLFQQTTHVSNDYKPRSTQAAHPVYLVQLFYFNLFHFLTGDVEASVRADGAVEHPMWCYVGHNRLARGMYNAVNTLFLNYAPEVTEAIYYTAKESADGQGV